VKDGSDILETDLHVSSDGEFICIHDATVDRTTNGKGEVRTMKLRMLKKFKTLDAESRETIHRIPSLKELLSILPENIAITLELKTDQFLDESVCQRLHKLLQVQGMIERTITLSFNLERLQSLRRSIPNIPIGWITMSRFIPNLPVELIGAFWPIFFINPFYVRMAHKRNLLVCPLDPNPKVCLKKYLRIGCDAVLADDPGSIRKELDDIQKKQGKHNESNLS